MISSNEIRNGDEPVFTRVFNACYAKVYHYFLKKTRSPATARELAQLTFIKLWEFRHTLSDDYTFDTQLFRMAAGVQIDYLRRERTQQRKVAAAADAGAGAVVSGEEKTEEPAFEQVDLLLSVTRQLSPVRKKVFILNRIHGHSYKEIAAQLSISVKTVEDHMSKAVRQIRQMVSHLFWLLLLLCMCSLPC